MPWYKIIYENGKVDYRHEKSEAEVLFASIKNGQWHISIREWKPKKLDYKTLKIFYEEIQSALRSGLQLNQAVSHFASSSKYPILATANQAILNQLEHGVIFNDALSKLTKTAATPYCHLLNSQGTREDCEQSLSVSIAQLKTLLDWSQRLLKALIYPFCIIQIAMMMQLVNRAFFSVSAKNYTIELSQDIFIYALCSAFQLYVIHNLHKGHACYWLEKYSANFRLTKLFSLLSTTRTTGVTLQHALKSMPDYFQYKPIKQEIYTVYYALRLGQHYVDSFPEKWFPNESAVALHSSEQGGDIERALSLAAREHEKHWQRNITLIEKVIPALCLLIAGGFVASALIALYSPLIEMP